MSVIRTIGSVLLSAVLLLGCAQDCIDSTQPVSRQQYLDSCTSYWASAPECDCAWARLDTQAQGSVVHTCQQYESALEQCRTP